MDEEEISEEEVVKKPPKIASKALKKKAKVHLPNQIE